MVLLLIILFLTIFEAAHEGLNLRGTNELNLAMRTWAGIIEVVKLLGITCIISFLIITEKFAYYQSFQEVWDAVLAFIPQFMVGWLFIRYAVFDYTHNLIAGISLDYIGKTKLYDRFWRWALQKQNIEVVHRWTRVILMFGGISLILKL